jgi:hypothetical protein
VGRSERWKQLGCLGSGIAIGAIAAPSTVALVVALVLMLAALVGLLRDRS